MFLLLQFVIVKNNNNKMATITSLVMYIRVRNIEKKLNSDTHDVERAKKLLKKYVDEFDTCDVKGFTESEILMMQNTLETVLLMLMAISYSVEALEMITTLKQMIQNVVVKQAAFQKRLIDDTQTFEKIGTLYQLPLDIKHTIATLVY